MPNATDQQIRALIASFLMRLSEQIRDAAVESVGRAFGDGGPPVPRRTRAGTQKAANAPEKTAAKGTSSRRKKSGKRDPEILAALVERLGAFIAKNPGRRIEEIAPTLGSTTKELALPAKKLIDAKTITTKGQKRATTYHPR